MKASFRRKVFLAASGAGLVTALVTATLLFWSLRREMHQRIDERVLLEARLVADQLERAGGAVPPGGFEAEANRLAALVQARVTFIADDGRVVGDSWVELTGCRQSKSTATAPRCSRPARTASGTTAA